MRQEIEKRVREWVARRSVSTSMANAAPLLLGSRVFNREHFETMDASLSFFRVAGGADLVESKKAKDCSKQILEHRRALVLLDQAIEELLIEWGMTKDEINVEGIEL